MRKITISLIILFVVLFAIFTAQNKALRAETAVGDSETLKKLDNILSNQKTILQGIADLREALNIVKIRVTQQQ